MKYSLTRLELHQACQKRSMATTTCRNVVQSPPMALHASSNLSDARRGDRIWTCRPQHRASYVVQLATCGRTCDVIYQTFLTCKKGPLVHPDTGRHAHTRPSLAAVRASIIRSMRISCESHVQKQAKDSNPCLQQTYALHSATSYTWISSHQCSNSWASIQCFEDFQDRERGLHFMCRLPRCAVAVASSALPTASSSKLRNSSKRFPLLTSHVLKPSNRLYATVFREQHLTAVCPNEQSCY